MKEINNVKNFDEIKESLKNDAVKLNNKYKTSLEEKCTKESLDYLRLLKDTLELINKIDDDKSPIDKTVIVKSDGSKIELSKYDILNYNIKRISYTCDIEGKYRYEISIDYIDDNNTKMNITLPNVKLCFKSKYSMSPCDLLVPSPTDYKILYDNKENTSYKISINTI